MERLSRTRGGVTLRLCQHCQYPSWWANLRRFSFAFPPFSVTKKSGVKSKIKPPPPPETLVLDVHSFDQVALVRTNVFGSTIDELTFNSG